MIHFVDMRKADIVGVRFSFWDTITSRTVVIDDEQGWDSVAELQVLAALQRGKVSCLPSTYDTPAFLERLIGLCPSWAYETGTSESILTFAELREANIARLPQFKNKHGEPAHSQPDGSDWSISDC